MLLAPAWCIAAPDDVEQVKLPEPANRQFFMDDNNFEVNVFQPSGNAKQARTQIETKLRLQLDELTRVCDLTDAQKQKLKLAASSDVKKVFDEYEVIRKKFHDSKHDQDAWNQAWQEVQPLQQKMQAGLFGDGSFFSKSIRKTLSEEQLSKFEDVNQERRRFRYRASIESAMVSLENSVALLHSQHEAIVKLLLEETKPPTSFGQYDQQVVLYQMSRVPESKLKPILNERQWKALQAQINLNRGMEQFLIQQGFLPKEDGEIKLLKSRVKRQTLPADAEAAAEPAKVQ